METLDQTKLIKKGSYLMLRLDHGIQILLFWAIVGCAITVYGLVISALLMIPWGVIQVLSALYNTYDKWEDDTFRQHYIRYWILVGIVGIVFLGAYFQPFVEGDIYGVIGMLMSAGIGCYHTYIIRRIYKTYNF